MNAAGGASLSYTEVSRCRACGNDALRPAFSLGRQALTGVFPRPGEPVGSGPVDMVRCDPAGRAGACGLVQLRQSYDTSAMYGDNYGYRSGLNPSMVRHLQEKMSRVLARVPVGAGDVVLDVGSNDATTLRCYPAGPRRIGMDPSGAKFRSYYPDGAELVVDFFSADSFFKASGGRKAKVVTSFAMFYDLEDPLGFMRQVAAVLAEGGVWVMEQSYLPAMLAQNAYDTVCHEHIEFYGLRQIDWMARRAGLKVLDVAFNGANGGSFEIWLAAAASALAVNEAAVVRTLAAEAGLDGPAPYAAFASRVEAHRAELKEFLAEARRAGKRVVGYGSSTKGNVLLQHCGLGPTDLECIGEVNPEKFGRVTPGTAIPIVPEAEMRARKPDYLLVLPWHFRDFIVEKEAAWRAASGAKLLFPLPRLEVVG